MSGYGFLPPDHPGFVDWSPSGKAVTVAGYAHPTWHVLLPFEQPRSLNDRRGHWAEAASRKKWREVTGWALKAAKVPHCGRVRVSLYYTPKVHRRRDPDNLVSSLKPCVDALMDAGVIDDDTQDYVERRWPEFLEPAKDAPDGRFLFVVEQLE